MANFTVTQSTNHGQGNVEGSLSWAIKQANKATGDFTITIEPDVSLTSEILQKIGSSVPMKERFVDDLLGNNSGSITLNNRLFLDRITSVDNEEEEESNTDFGGSIQISTSGVIVIGVDPITVETINEIVGTTRRDVLLGTNKADRVLGQAGNDVLSGARGDDTISGGNGNDRILGEQGDDALSGGAGNDLLTGGRGNDSLDGGTGRDRLLGGGGDDELLGGIGNDFLQGDTGNDTLNGGKGNDRLFGGSGNDRLTGGEGNDFLTGGAGNDRLEGGKGRDTLIGGGGRDTFVIAAGGRSSVRDVILDFDIGQDKIEVLGLSLGALDFKGSRISIAETSEIIAVLTGVDTSTLSAVNFTSSGSTGFNGGGTISITTDFVAVS